MAMDRSSRMTFVPVLVALLISISGCTTYRQAAIPGPDGKAAYDLTAATVAAGSSVRVTRHSGAKYSGVVGEISAGELTLVGRGNYGYTDMTIRLDDIEKIEVRRESDARIERSWFLGLGAAALVALYLSLPIMHEGY